jgi:hypothetical protein
MQLLSHCEPQGEVVMQGTAHYKLFTALYAAGLFSISWVLVHLEGE